MLWALAVVVNYGGAGILHWLPGRGQRVSLRQTDIAGEHLIERFRLFLLIVLGESVLTAGNAFTDEAFEVGRLLELAIGFTGTVALWWCYFQRTEAIGIEVAETAADAGGVGCSARRTQGPPSRSSQKLPSARVASCYLRVDQRRRCLMVNGCAST